MKVTSVVRGLVSALLVAVGAQADTIYVPGDYPTIQGALVAVGTSALAGGNVAPLAPPANSADGEPLTLPTQTLSPAYAVSSFSPAQTLDFISVNVLPEGGEAFEGATGNNDRPAGSDVWDGLPAGPKTGPKPVPHRTNQRGAWPVYLATPAAGFPYTPTLYDADGDGADEIFLTGGHTFALRGDGTFLPGWPTSEMIYMGYGTNGNMPGPSVADLDGDGDTEVLWTLRDWWAGNVTTWCFNGKNLDATDLPSFPQEAVDDLSNALFTPFVLGDTDGDGDLEAWGAHTLGNNFVHYRVSAFDHLGNRLFTVDLNPAENIVSLYFGDLDGDGTKEMFAVSWLDPSFRLHVFEADGSEASGYPIVLHTFTGGYLMFGPPIPADLDDDGDLEILLGHWGDGESQALCLHHDGTECAGFPIQVATDSQLFYLGLGDVTGDGEPELVAFDNHLSGSYRVYVIDLATGVALPGWPYGVPDWPKGFPAVADVDNDGLQDVCLATDGGELHAVSSDGQLIEGYPKQMVSASISGVAVGDIDGDGLFELVAATWDGWVYAWDTPGEALPGRADWPMRGLNARNTGVFGEVECQLPGDGDCDGDVDLSDFAAYLDCVTGPAGGDLPPGCGVFDFDGDEDVDFPDFAVFMQDFTGSL